MIGCAASVSSSQDQQNDRPQTGSTPPPKKTKIPSDNKVIAYFNPIDKSIYLLTNFSKKTKLITVEDGSATWPIFSPDGNRIAFTGSVKGVMATYAMDARTGRKVKQITKPEGDLPEGVLDWHTDGRLVSVTKNREGNAEIYLVKDSSNMTNLTKHKHWDFFPLSHPDGLISFWTSRDDPNANSKEYDYQSVYTVNSDGTNLRKRFQISEMTNESVGSGIFPTISPDGKTYVFMMNHDLYKIRMDGTGLINLTNTKDTAELFPFFPCEENDRVYFVSQTKETALNIFSMDLKNRKKTQHTFFSDEIILYPKFKPSKKIQRRSMNSQAIPKETVLP
jgi:Tol biopolymer transport system component